jgi:hypothetical protein
VVRGKAVAFLCLLIAEQSRIITDEEVHALPGWGDMARDSVGKQVARNRASAMPPNKLCAGQR